ncbi:MAG: NAD-dependent epimerase/dehydratase family protein [Candidatus Nanohalobium sp.]
MIVKQKTQRRPFVHVKDTARAFIEISEADKDKVSGEIFNVGSNEQNYQIKPLAEKIMKAFDFEVGWEWYGDPDDRSYKVDFTKIRETIGFEPKHTPEEAAKTIYQKIDDGELEKTEKTSTVGWYKKLLKSERNLDGKKIESKLL